MYDSWKYLDFSGVQLGGKDYGTEKEKWLVAGVFSAVLKAIFGESEEM